MTSLSLNATIEGVVRSPSEFSMTFALVPSMTATHEFVVPRSIPMILPIFLSLSRAIRFRPQGPLMARKLGVCASVSSKSLGSGSLRNGDQRRPQQPIVEHVALLHDRYDRVRLMLATRHEAHRLVALGIERLADRIDDLQPVAVDHARKLAERQLHAAAKA